MAKVDLELVKMVLTRNEVETRLVAGIIQELQQENAAEADEDKEPPCKKQWVVVVYDPEGELAGKEFTGTVVQIPEDESVYTAVERLHRAGYEFNTTKKGRRMPVQTGYGERGGQAPRVPGLDKPLGTVVAGGVKHALVSAFLAKHYTGVVGHELDRPIGTVTTQDHHSVVTATLAPGADHSEQVHAFLVKYYGTGGGQSVKEPMGTVTTKDRFGLVTVRGEQFRIVDIGLRMLTPRELARAQGFPDDYKLTGTTSSQVARIGNSVCPPVAAALVKANCGKEVQHG